jgi:hypothetical protein
MKPTIARSRRQPVAFISGMVAGDPGQGGASCAVFQWIVGLRRAGFDVVLVEPVVGAGQALARTAAYFEAVTARAGLAGRAAMMRRRTGEVLGMAPEGLAGLASRAELLVNVSGMLPLAPPFDTIPARIYLDLDPAFNQLWQAADGVDMRMGGHTHHVTVGTRVGQPDCLVPTLGIDWITTLPPVDLEWWPVATGIEHDALTTVGNWRSYGSIHHNGLQFGQKAHSVRDLLALARRSPKPLRPALAIHPAEVDDLGRLTEHGWQLLDPVAVAGDPDRYRQFVQGSWGELGIAKSGYIVSRSGWFSDRSACYLASGRPVIAQDTGFADALPVGEGLLAFSDVDEAVDGIGRVVADYDAHRRAARCIAETHLEAGAVVRRMLERAGL